MQGQGFGLGGPNMIEGVIQECIAGVTYPATKQQLIDSVKNHTFSKLSGETAQVVRDKAAGRLEMLPSTHDYDSYEQVMKEAGLRQKV